MNNQITKAATMAIIAFSASIVMAQDVKVNINDKPLEFQDAQPQYVNGRVLVPLRGIFEELGATVRWNQETQSVRAEKNGKIIRLTIGSKTARVNNQRINLDVPPMIIDGSTMVPVRFVSESLGAQVGWNESNQLVSIQTSDDAYARNQERDNTNHGRAERIGRHELRAGMVIPVRLNTELSSDGSRRGDVFSAKIDTWSGPYSAFPRGSRIIGHVVSARPKSGHEPGLLELAFDSIKTPNGETYPIEASLNGLDNKSISTAGDGTISSRGNSKDRTNVFAGIGAGAGLVVGMISHRPLEDTAIGGILGFIAGQVDKNQTQAKNVELKQGTRFGVRLDQDLRL